jgi:hypothetical protein
MNRSGRQFREIVFLSGPGCFQMNRSGNAGSWLPFYPSDVAGEELEPFFSHDRYYRRFHRCAG